MVSIKTVLKQGKSLTTVEGKFGKRQYIKGDVNNKYIAFEEAIQELLKGNKNLKVIKRTMNQAYLYDGKLTYIFILDGVC